MLVCLLVRHHCAKVKKYIHIFPVAVAWIELFCYSFTTWQFPYSGVPKAAPKFRDLYVLILNANCKIDPSQFAVAGSCSDLFYGVPPGSFDYPLPLFYIAQHMPKTLFLNPSLLGFLSGSIFLTTIFFTSSLIKSSRKRCIALCLVIFSFPTRYLLERGQLDTFSWSLALSVYIAARLVPKSRQFSPILLIWQNASLWLAALVKGFTLPALAINNLTFFRSRRWLPFWLSLAAIILACMVLITPDRLPGHHSSLVQLNPGEIFGFRIGLKNSSTFFQETFLLKIVFILIGTVWMLANMLREGLRYPNQRIGIPPYYSQLFNLSASSYLAFYFLTASANYKLFPVALLFLCFQISPFHSFNAESNAQGLKYQNYTKQLFNSSLGWPHPRQLLSAIALVIIYSNYMPYLPELQFLKIDFLNFILEPFFVGSLACLVTGKLLERGMHRWTPL